MEFPYQVLSDKARRVLKQYEYSVYMISADILILVGKCKVNNRLFFEERFERLDALEDYILHKIAT